MGWFAARCPVDERERVWLEESMTWFVGEFGADVLRRDVVTPTPEFFPGEFHGSDDEVLALIHRVCGWFDVDTDRVTVEFYGDHGERQLSEAMGLTSQWAAAAGHYRRENGRAILGIDRTLAVTPVRMVATVAHELCHVLLLDDGRITGDRADHEPLTDLLTVYFGLGVFSANAAFEYTQTMHRRSTSTLGYLPEPMFGYGLACHAMLRGERKPDWADHLDPNPRAVMKRGLRYLAEHPFR
jgi:hypothetical protein